MSYIDIILFIISFLNIEILQVLKSFLMTKQGPVNFYM